MATINDYGYWAKKFTKAEKIAYTKERIDKSKKIIANLKIEIGFLQKELKRLRRVKR